MGLDMYAYVANKANQRADFYESSEWDPVAAEFVNHKVQKPREIAYWRKHPNLHGWMADLWQRRVTQGEGDVQDFNGVELELFWEDLDQLEQDILNSRLPSTTGFFFGNEADDYYKEQDLQFIKNAKAELFSGLRVFYDSSW